MAGEFTLADHSSKESGSGIFSNERAMQ